MFKYLKMNMWKDGTEHCTAYANFGLDKRELWIGTSYHLENNHKKNTYEIQLFNQNGYVKTVAKGGKDETLCLQEFKDWLIKNNINDAYMDFLKNNKWYCEKYPNVMGGEIARKLGENDG